MKDNKLIALMVAGIAFICVVVVGLVIAMQASGLEVFRKEKVETAPPAPPEIVSTKWKVSPASVTLKDALDKAPSGWETQGNLLETPQAPYPFSCTTEGINPALSYAQNFKAKGKGVQVMLSAYTAGLAEAGLADKVNRATSCGGGTYSIYGLSQFDNGYQVNVSTGVQKTKTIIFRHGDVVAYVIGDANNSNMFAVASDFEKHLSKKMQKVCANPNYKGNETSRSPFSHDEYKGYYTTAKVVIPEVELPEIPKEEKFKAVKIGEKVTPVKEVELPEKPTEYPVWPELPESMNKPTAPEVPKKKADTTRNYDKRTEDEIGPGCGWNFTGSTAPEFIKEEVDTQNKMTKQSNEELLVRDARKWQESVLAYWKAYDKYEKDAPKWNKYVTEVNKVSDAWDEIRANWNAYWTAHAVWEQQVRERDAFLARQEQAQKNYDNAIRVCEEWEAGREERETKQREANEELKKYRESEKKLKEEWDNAEKKKLEEDSEYKPKPYESENEPPTFTPEPAPNCPAVKPVILDQAPPQVGAEPKKPADPRPESERE